MILMHPDYLLFRVGNGETIPCSAEVATVELLGDACALCDPELVRGAASAVLHYFKHELGRDCVSVAEFAEALARVLRSFGLKVALPDEEPGADGVATSDPADGGAGVDGLVIPAGGAGAGPLPATLPGVVEADLREIASACGKGFELAFFPRLRVALRLGLQESPALVRFTGLRGCVKLLLGARRWGPRCQELNDRIIEYLRGCLRDETAGSGCALVVK